MLKPALIISTLVAIVALTLPLAGHAQERRCPDGTDIDGFVTPTEGTNCEIVTGTFEGSRNALGLPQLRRYIRITPTQAASEPQPLFVLLHARDTDIEPMANLTRVGRLARDHGITIVLPEAIDGRFNDDPLTPPPPGLQMQDDVAFISTVIADAIAEGTTDPARVFIAGYSNGGFMSQRMVCEKPELFAGLGSVASSLRFGLENNCPAAPKAMVKVFIHGTDDEVVLYQGLPFNDDTVPNNALIAYRSAPSTASFWAARNGCSNLLDDSPIPTILPTNGDGTTVDYFRYNCASGIPPLITYRVNGGGHTWPGSLGFAGGTAALLGPITTQLDATTALWTHFTRPNTGNQVMPDQLRPEGSGGGSMGLSLLAFVLLGLLGRVRSRRPLHST